MSGAVWAVVVAGGEGRRFGGPKQFERIGGKLVLEWAISAARAVADGVVLVLASEHLRNGDLHGGADRVVAGGMQRAESVRAGLAAVPSEAEIVIVHDAARPLASPELFHAVIAALDAGADGAIPALALSDTVKRVNAGRVVETLDRSELFTVQTPQAFRAAVLREAHAGYGHATDDAALLEAIGAPVAVVAGETCNIKITTPDDLVFASMVLASLSERGRP